MTTNTEKKFQKTESKKILHTFAAASFLNDLGSDMIYPIWPLFIRFTLGANMTILGLLDGIGDAVVSLSQAVSGYYSDKSGKRKIFIWTGYTMGALSRIGYALSTTWAMVLPFRILDRAGKIRGAPRDAIIADISTGANRGKNFGLLRTADHFGAVLGILLCLLLIRFSGFTTIFLLAALPSLIGVSLILIKIKDRPAHEIKVFKGISLADLSIDFKRFLVLSAAFSTGWFSYSFLLLFAKDVGYSIQTVPVFYLLFTVVAAFTSYPFGYLADRWGRKMVIGLGFLFWMLACLSFIWSRHLAVVILVFIFYGLSRAALETAQKAFVSELCPPEHRASSLGGFQMIVGLCALPASLIAGVLWDMVGREAPLIFSLVLTVISLLLLLRVKENKV
ncbi:MAG TPA: MFS transporter [Bacteroidetes bacterium]|nr:MFS transporter [Bacteroidota bacterium]